MQILRSRVTRTTFMPGLIPDYEPRHARRRNSREAPTPSDASATSAPRPTSNTQWASDETGPIRIGAWNE